MGHQLYCKRQCNAVIDRHLADVDEGITHTTQCGIDGYAGDIGYLLETEILIVAHENNLTLIVGQSIDQTAHVTQCLLVDHCVLYVGFGQTGIVQQVILLSIVADGVLILILAEIVNDEVMGYTGKPCAEFAGAGVTALLESYYCFYECILEDVIGKVAIAYNKVDVRIQLVLIT